MIAMIRFFILCVLFSLSPSFASHATEGQAISIIQSADFDGLSLNSSSIGIESYIASQPSTFTCNRQESEGHALKVSGRTIPPSKSWQCSYNEQNHFKMLNAFTQNEKVKRIELNIRYTTNEEYQSLVQKAQSLFNQLQQAGMPSDNTHNLRYENNDSAGASSPNSSMNFKASIEKTCQGKRVVNSITVNASKIPSQNVYTAKILQENSEPDIICP